MSVLGRGRSAASLRTPSFKELSRCVRFVRLTTACILLLLAVSAFPGCSSGEVTVPRWTVAPCKPARWTALWIRARWAAVPWTVAKWMALMDKGKMGDGAMDKGKMDGAMDKGKMDGHSRSKVRARCTRVVPAGRGRDIGDRVAFQSNVIGPRSAPEWKRPIRRRDNSALHGAASESAPLKSVSRSIDEPARLRPSNVVSDVPSNSLGGSRSSRRRPPSPQLAGPRPAEAMSGDHSTGSETLRLPRPTAPRASSAGWPITGFKL